MAGRVVADLYLGALGWVDISERVRQPVADSGGGITITRERPEGRQVADPGHAALVIDNDGGDFSPRNPRSPYHGILGRNTPIRAGIRLVADDFDRTVSNSWGTTTTGQVWSNYFSPTSAYAVSASLATQSHSTVNQLRAARLNMSLLDAEQVSDIEVPAAVTGAAAVAGHQYRAQSDGSYYWLRLEFNAGSSTTTVKIVRSDAGVLTTLAEIVAVSGLTYTAGQPLRLRTSVVGRRLSLMAWDPTDPEPSDWMLTWADDSDDAVLTPGLLGIETWLVAGNSNSLPFAFGIGNYEVVDRRLWMEVPTWPTRWNVAGTDVWAPIEAAGILRRLGQGERPVLSALSRYVASTENLVAAWMLDDGEDATIAAPLLPTGTPLTVQAGVMDFVPDEGPPGTGGAAHPDPTATNALTGTITGASSSAWQVSIWSKGRVTDEELELVGDPAASAYYVAWEIVTTTNQVLRLAFQWEEDRAIGVAHWTGLDQTTPTNVVYLDDSGSPRTNPGITNEWLHVQFTIEQDGADCIAILYVNGQNVHSLVWSGLTIGAPRDITTPSAFGAGNAPSLNVEEFWLTGLAIHNTGTLVAEQYEAGLGYPDESAADRLERESAVEGVAIAIVRGPDDSPAMGPQLPATYLDIARDCADVDQGVLYETRERVGLAYVCGSALLNQADAVTIDYAAGQLAPPLEPVDDDLDVANDITVKRTAGSSARAILESGRMSVLPPEDGGIGRYATEHTANVAADDQLSSQAWWRLHISTWDEARYPRIAVNLAAPDVDQDLTAAVVALEDGGIVALTSLPDWLPPGPVRAMVRGGVEYIGDDAEDGLQRSIAWSASPAGPYDVAEVDGEGLVPADGSTLGSTLSASGTLLSVTSTTENGLWNPEPADDWPLDLRVGGERIVIDALGQVLNANPMMRSAGTTGWVGSNAAIARDLTHQFHPDWGSLLVTPNGSSASGGANGSARVTVAASAQYLALCFVWATNSMQLGPAVDWHTGAGAFISNGFVGPVTVSAGVWTPISGLLTSPGTAGQALMRARHAGTPPAGNTWWTTGICLIPVSSYNASPQSMTVGERGVNGVQREWAAGTPVDVWQPLIVAW